MRIVKIVNLEDAERDEVKRLYQAHLDAAKVEAATLTAFYEFKRAVAAKYEMRFDRWGMMEGDINFTEDFSKAIGMGHSKKC